MKKLALALLVISLARVGVAYADTNTATSTQYSTGAKVSSTNANQILYFYRGADGKNGANGKDGTNGKDGLNGLNGVPGVDGVSVSTVSFTGEQGGCKYGGVQINSSTSTTYVCNGSTGSGVVSVLFTGARSTCTNGGIEFTDSNGVKTYACNGRDGSPGSSGKDGSNTVTTSGSGSGGFTYAQGSVLVGACDKFVAIKPLRSYTRIGFTFSGFNIGDNSITVVDTSTSPSTTLDGGVSSSCNSYNVTVEFFTDSAYAGAPYSASDHIACVSKQTLGSYTPNGTDTRTLSGGTYGSLTSGDFECTADSSNATPSLRPKFALAYVNTADYTDKIGFLIG